MNNIRFKTVATIFAALFCFGTFNEGWTKSTEDKIKEKIDDFADSLKHAVDKCGDDMAAIQSYLDHYHWKGVIQDEAASGPANLKYLQMNGHSRVVVVKPGERIKGIVVCNLDRDKCSALNLYRVLLGIKGVGAQTTIGNELGLAAGESLEEFSLIAPAVPGIYQVRFKVVEKLLESSALDAWTDEKGNEPDGTTTIGLIVVK